MMAARSRCCLKTKKADKRDKNDTHSRPNGVSYAYRNALQYDTQTIESRRVPQNGQYGRNEFGKLFALFQKEVATVSKTIAKNKIR